MAIIVFFVDTIFVAVIVMVCVELLLLMPLCIVGVSEATGSLVATSLLSAQTSAAAAEI